MQTLLLTSFFVIMVISLELAAEEGGGEVGGRSREGRRRKKRGRRMKSWMREEGGHPLVCVAKRSLCLLLTHGCIVRTVNSHHLSDCIGQSERAETWQLHALADDCPE